MQLIHHRVGAGEPLVLLHGIGSRWQVWEPVLDRLAADRDVLALDLPGFGESPPPPPGTPAGVASLTGLVAEFLDELGLERPHLAGNSLGGRIALELGKQGRARTATALSPQGFHTPAEARYQYASLWTSARIARLIAPYADRLMARDTIRAGAIAQLASRPKRLPPPDAAASVRALANAPWFDATLSAANGDRFSGGELLGVPVTIAWGEHDRVLLPRQAKRAVAEIRGARLVMLRGCGHVPTYDDPDQVATVLLEGSAVHLSNPV